MNNFLLNYITSHLYDKHIEEDKRGPVITISRDYGCEGYEITELLLDAINKHEHHKTEPQEWSIVNKNILKQNAQELHATQEKISNLLVAKQIGFLEEFIATFTDKDYQSDFKLIKVLTKTINALAEQGHVIIVGRAGYIISQDIPRSIHVKIVGPMSWRITKVAERYGITRSEAMHKIEDMDEKRKSFLQFFKCDKPHFDIFDITLNRKNFSKLEIVDILMNIIKQKRFI
ncbi:MAG: cytidylate kinase-like family protein [Bacteroidota bacterium]|nr:cytidylate kinase-like family protein [Bacteroidota bacterium]